MERKRFFLVLVIIGLLVLVGGISYAYYSVGVQGIGNINVEASATTAILGEVEFNGENTFDTTNIGREIYPGFIGVQEFSVSPYRDGQGIYEVDLAATVPQAFGNDIKLTLYKTTNKASNHIDSEEGSLTIVDGEYTKQDILNITGTLEKVYEGSLVTTDITMLEQVEFIIANNAFTKPIVTPDGYVTYYAVYEYLDNGDQNNQQGLSFSSKITVKYVGDIARTAADTLQQLQELNPDLVLTQSTTMNPNFARKSPKDSPGTPYYGPYIRAGTMSYITYASDFTYDQETGHYTLVNYTTCKYSTCYADLEDKYIVLNGDRSSWGSDTNEAIYESSFYADDEIDKVLSADSDGIDSVLMFTGSELNDVKEGKWQIQTSGLYESEDNYGTSYYFRGDIDNNYVKFGKWQTDYYSAYDSSEGVTMQYTSLSECEEATYGCTKYASAGDDMYWRIVRINGDGSIRMIYDGTSAYGKNDLEMWPSLFRSIGLSSFNNNSSDNAAVGYMYGTTGSNNYNDTHANINDSTIKAHLDTWYSTQMMGYSSYISDTLFCNDRGVASSDAINFYNGVEGTTLGSSAFGTNFSLYSPSERVIDEQLRRVGNRATLICPNKNDRFTVNDTTIGNGVLTYPVGLITIDEVDMAGGIKCTYEAWCSGEINMYNFDYYLKTGDVFWTGSPNIYSYGAIVYYVTKDGSFGEQSVYIDEPLRPVINLKYGSIVDGSGTAQDPFVVE